MERAAHHIPGTTGAPSFGVAVDDVYGTPRYTDCGGIQLADRLEGDRFVHVSQERLFAVPELDCRVVDLSLRGWPGERDASREDDHT